MNALELQENLVDIMFAGLVAMIVGSPGIGKSDIVRQIAKRYKLKVIDLRLSQCDPTDMLGFPTHDHQRMTYVPPDHFPLEGIDTPPPGFDGWLLFLDELTSAPLSVQAASYKLALDRMIGQYQLHSRCIVMCAGNKATDQAIVNRLSTAMQSRLIHLELSVDVPAWISWATGHGIDHRVVSYIESHTSHLHNFNPDHDDSTFACPRTWEFVSKLIKGKDVLPRHLNLLCGTISSGIAHEFNAYLSYCASLPKIQDIEKNPTTIAVPEEPALLYAISHMVAAYINETSALQLMQYLKRLPVEFGVTAVRAVAKRNKNVLQNIPAVRDWAHEVAKEIF